jgi:subfamily B ATP-binding cassette protein MsbA
LASRTLFASLLLLYRLQPHICALDHCRVELAGLAAAMEDVISLRDEAGKPYVHSGTRPFPGLRSSIVFENVTFDYQGHSLCLASLKKGSPRIGCGEMTPIVGGRGAGKSTIINLIYRLFDPQEGLIKVDGAPLEELDVIAWRASLGIAGQDAELKNDTISNNIAYGRAGAARAHVIEAAKKAAAHDSSSLYLRATIAGSATAGYASRLGSGNASASRGPPCVSRRF